MDGGIPSILGVRACQPSSQIVRDPVRREGMSEDDFTGPSAFAYAEAGGPSSMHYKKSLIQHQSKKSPKDSF